MAKERRKVYFPVGISGAGKDYVYRMFFMLAVLLSPDELRKIRTGNISDQSRNGEVFDLHHFMMAREMSYGARDIYLSETHLWLPGIQEELNMVLAYGYEPVFVILESSRDWKLCQSRVREALACGEDRSDTVDVIGRSGKLLIEEMSEKFVDLVESEEFKELVAPYKVIHL